MKIIYDENPLKTVVELDESDKMELWYKIKIEQMEHRMFTVHFYLDESRLDLDRARDDADPSYYLNGTDDGKTPLDVRVDDLHEYYIEALLSDHVGDCTCVACSCDKCHAEDLIGIDTIPGLGKHEAHYIQITFQECKNIHEVLGALKNYEPHASWKGWEPNAERWKSEATGAYEWLYTYVHEHFSY